MLSSCMHVLPVGNNIELQNLFEVLYKRFDAVISIQSTVIFLI